MSTLEHHVWLNLTEMQDAGKVCFLDAPISQGGLFGNTIEVFLQQLTAVKKQMEAIRHPALASYRPPRSRAIAEAIPLNGGPPAGR